MYQCKLEIWVFNCWLDKIRQLKTTLSALYDEDHYGETNISSLTVVALNASAHFQMSCEKNKQDKTHNSPCPGCRWRIFLLLCGLRRLHHCSSIPLRLSKMPLAVASCYLYQQPYCICTSIVNDPCAHTSGVNQQRLSHLVRQKMWQNQ